MRDNSQQSNSKSHMQDSVPELQYAPVSAESKSGIFVIIVIKSVMWLGLGYWAFYKFRFWNSVSGIIDSFGGYDSVTTRWKIIIISKVIIDPLMLAVVVFTVFCLTKRKKQTPVLFAILLLEYVYFQVCAYLIPAIIALARSGAGNVISTVMRAFWPVAFAEWIALTALSVFFIRSRRVKQLFTK